MIRSHTHTHSTCCLVAERRAADPKRKSINFSMIEFKLTGLFSSDKLCSAFVVVVVFSAFSLNRIEQTLCEKHRNETVSYLLRAASCKTGVDSIHLGEFFIRHKMVSPVCRAAALTIKHPTNWITCCNQPCSVPRALAPMNEQINCIFR